MQSLPLATEIDRAHLVMLSEAAIVGEDRVWAILHEMLAFAAAILRPCRAPGSARAIHLV